MSVLFNHKGDLHAGFQEDLEYILDECVERILNQCESMVAAYDINRIPQPELNAVRMQLSMMLTHKFTVQLSERQRQAKASI